MFYGKFRFNCRKWALNEKVSRKLPKLAELTRKFPYNKLLFCGYVKIDSVWYNHTEPQNNKLVGTDNAARVNRTKPGYGRRCGSTRCYLALVLGWGSALSHSSKVKNLCDRPLRVRQDDRPCPIYQNVCLSVSARTIAPITLLITPMPPYKELDLAAVEAVTIIEGRCLLLSAFL